MIQYLKRKYRKWHTKRTFQEYGHELHSFKLSKDGRIDYAHWLHPWNMPVEITQEAVDCARSLVNEGDTVIDIGAYTGDTTVPLAIACGKDGCVFALEPNRYAFRILETNAELNPEKTRIVPLNIAATQDDGTYVFHYTDASFCNGGYMSQIAYKRHRHKYPLLVEGRNLDRLLRDKYPDRLKKLSFVKIDAEGYDKDIIVSIMNLLKDFRPVIQCEVFLRLKEQERRDLYDIIRRGDYVPFKYEGSANPIGDRLSRKDMFKWKHFDILAVPEESA